MFKCEIEFKMENFLREIMALRFRGYIKTSQEVCYTT